MARLRVHCFGVSLDGFGAGPGQDLQNPLGVGGVALHEWVFPTRTFTRMHGGDGGTTGVDDDLAAPGIAGIGAWIVGRNMFGPVRGPWPDESWKGWWGDDPPYHLPVFVLTHHARPTLAMKGGTVFHFVTGGIRSALEQAGSAAGGQDEMHLAFSPALLGSGEHLFAGLDLKKLGYACTEHVPSAKATHVVLRRVAV